jgi:hypothetical protein
MNQGHIISRVYEFIARENIGSGFILTLYMDYVNNQVQYCTVALFNEDKKFGGRR